MSRNVIPIEVKRKCVEMSCEGKTAKEIYTEYYSQQFDTKYTTFQVMLSNWRKKAFADNELLESANLGYNFTPHNSTVQIDKDGKIVQAWIKQHTQDNVYFELIEEIKKNTPYIKIEPVATIEKERMLEINLCDMHFGISDLDYYRPTLNEILLLIQKGFDEINVIIGQDMLHNDDFDGRTRSGRQIQKVDMAKAWNDAKTFWFNVIDTSVRNSNKTNIRYVPGNHDYSMTWAFVQVLKQRYIDLDVDDSLDKRKCMTYGTNFIGLTHGEFKRSKPSDLRSQFSVKFPIEFAQSKVKEIHCSHLHTEWEKDEYGVMIRRLSTSNKTDDWHEEEGFIGSHRRFMIFEWTKDKLASIHYV